MPRRFVVALGVIALTSCGRPAAEAPANVASSASRELLGAEADFAFSVRIDRLRDDPVYSQILHDAKLDKELAQLFESVGGVDGVGTFDGKKLEHVSLVGVLRGPPPFDQLPKKWRREIEEGGAAQKLPSGVWEYVSLDKHGWPFGFYATAHEFVLLTGHAAGPGHDWFSTHSAAPPPVEFGADVLAGFFVGPGAMKKQTMAEANNDSRA